MDDNDLGLLAPVGLTSRLVLGGELDALFA
jgi:hypothetical protein